MNNTIKELVKKHFNLVEATEQSFGEIKTADGELTLSYEGDELAQGLAIFVVTPEGNIPAPDGEHMLDGDITIVTADGKIEAIKETEAPAEEELEEEIVSEEMAEESEEEVMEEHEEEKMEEPVEAIADAVTEEVAEEVSDAVEAAIDEEVVSAVAEAVKEVVEEMTKEMEERMKSLEDKYASFSSAPASEKTIASSFSKKSKEENYKNASSIEAMIARKKKKG
jgi:hypothetical protein